MKNRKLVFSTAFLVSMSTLYSMESDEKGHSVQGWQQEQPIAQVIYSQSHSSSSTNLPTTFSVESGDGEVIKFSEDQLKEIISFWHIIGDLGARKENLPSCFTAEALQDIKQATKHILAARQEGFTESEVVFMLHQWLNHLESTRVTALAHASHYLNIPALEKAFPQHYATLLIKQDLDSKPLQQTLATLDTFDPEVINPIVSATDIGSQANSLWLAKNKTGHLLMQIPCKRALEWLCSDKSNILMLLGRGLGKINLPTQKIESIDVGTTYDAIYRIHTTLGLISIRHEKDVRIFHISSKNNSPLHTLKLDGPAPYCIQFSDDGEFLICANAMPHSQTMIKIVNIKDGSLKDTFNTTGTFITDLMDQGPVSIQLLNNYKEIKDSLYPLSTIKQHFFYKGQKDKLIGVALIPESNRKKIVVWDALTMTKKFKFHHKTGITSLTGVPGTPLLLSTALHEVTCYNLQTGLTAYSLAFKDCRVNSYIPACKESNRFLVNTSKRRQHIHGLEDSVRSKQLCLYDLASGQLVKKLIYLTPALTRADYSFINEGKNFLYNISNKLHIFDSQTGHELQSIPSSKNVYHDLRSPYLITHDLTNEILSILRIRNDKIATTNFTPREVVLIRLAYEAQQKGKDFSLENYPYLRDAYHNASPLVKKLVKRGPKAFWQKTKDFMSNLSA